MSRCANFIVMCPVGYCAFCFQSDQYDSIWIKYICSDSNFVLAKNWFVISNNNLKSQLRCIICKLLAATLTLPTSNYYLTELWIFEVQHRPYVDVA